MWKWLGLTLVALILAILVLFVARTREKTHARPSPALNPVSARMNLAEPSLGPDQSVAKHKPSVSPAQWIRIRRADGRVDIVEETGEALRPLMERIKRSEELFNKAQEDLQDNFFQTLESKGASEAWALVEPYLRNPSRDVTDLARVYRAVDFLVSILHGIGLDDEETRRFAPLASNLNSCLRSLLVDDSIDPYVKKIALASLGGNFPSISFHGPTGTLTDGLYTYDEEEPIAPTVMVRFTPSTEGAIPHPLLRDPGFVELLSKILNGRDSSPYVRDAALIALASRRVLLDSVDLVSIAAHDPSEVVRRTAIVLLPLRTERLDSEAFLTVLKAQKSDDMRAELLKSFGSADGHGRELVDVLRSVLSSPNHAPEDSDWWKSALYIDAAIAVGLDRYARLRDPELFSLLTSNIHAWAAWEGKGDSPLSGLSQHAANRGLREFAPYLRTALPSVKREWDRRLIGEALQKLGH